MRVMPRARSLLAVKRSKCLPHKGGAAVLIEGSFMPNRVIRDELITSERWWSVSADARSLWLSIALSADDTGRCPGSNFVCRTKYMAAQTSHDRIEKIVAELHDSDLIRIYMVDCARYFFIPRFRQFLRYTNSRYPAPPQEINDLVIKKQFSGNSQATPKHPEVKRSEVKRSEEKTPLAPSDVATITAVAYIPLIGQAQFAVSADFVKELENAYPAVEPIQTLKEIRAWCIANPTKRKTKGGAARFINAWFAKEQNHG